MVEKTGEQADGEREVRLPPELEASFGELSQELASMLEFSHTEEAKAELAEMSDDELLWVKSQIDEMLETLESMRGRVLAAGQLVGSEG